MAAPDFGVNIIGTNHPIGEFAVPLFTMVIVSVDVNILVKWNVLGVLESASV